MNLEDLPPIEVMWEGRFVRALRRGKWEYASRARDIRAVVILAEHDGQVILVDQPRKIGDALCGCVPSDRAYCLVPVGGIYPAGDEVGGDQSPKQD